MEMEIARSLIKEIGIEFMDLDDASVLEKEVLGSILFPKEGDAYEFMSDVIANGNKALNPLEEVEEWVQSIEPGDESGKGDDDTTNNPEMGVSAEVKSETPLIEKGATDKDELCIYDDDVRTIDTLAITSDLADGGDEGGFYGHTASMNYSQAGFNYPDHSVASWLHSDYSEYPQVLQYPASPLLNTAPYLELVPFPESYEQLPSIMSPDVQRHSFWDGYQQIYVRASPQVGSVTCFPFPPSQQVPLTNEGVFGGTQPQTQFGLRRTEQPISNFRASELSVAQRRKNRNKNRNRSGDAYCHFCWKNNETFAVYSAHVLRNAAGELTCPILMRHVCPICNQTGPNAHTARFCPARNNDDGEPHFSFGQRKGALASVGRNPFRD